MFRVRIPGKCLGEHANSLIAVGFPVAKGLLASFEVLIAGEVGGAALIKEPLGGRGQPENADIERALGWWRQIIFG